MTKSRRSIKRRKRPSATSELSSRISRRGIKEAIAVVLLMFSIAKVQLPQALGWALLAIVAFDPLLKYCLRSDVSRNRLSKIIRWAESLAI